MKATRQNSILENLFYNVIYQVLILIVPFVTAPYVSRVLHPEGLGTYSVTTSIAKYFWMFALLGMQNYGNRVIARDREDKKKLSVSFSNLFYFQALISILVLFLYFLYAVLYGYGKYGIVALCQIPYVLSALFEVSWFFYGTEQFRFMVLRNTIIKVITTVSVFCLVKTESDVWIYALINSLSLLAGQLCLWPFLLRKIKLTKPNWSIIKSHLKPNLILMVSVVAVSLYTLMSKILIEVMSTRAEVGYFENTEKMMNMCNGVVGAIGMVMLPRVTFLVGQNNDSAVNAYLSKSMKYIMALAIGISFGLAGIAQEFSVVYFGQEYKDCGITIMTISMAVLFYSWENILRTQYLLPRNKDGIFVKGTIFAAIANVALNIALIPSFGALGASIGTVGAQVTAAIYQSFCVRRELEIGKYLRMLFPTLLIAILMFAYCRVVGNIFGPSIKVVVTQIIGGCAIFFLLEALLLFLKKDELILKIVNYYKGREKSQ